MSVTPLVPPLGPYQVGFVFASLRPSPLLSLPTEIRRMIYDLLLRNARSDELRPLSHHGRRDLDCLNIFHTTGSNLIILDRRIMPVMLSCHQIRSELFEYCGTRTVLEDKSLIPNSVMLVRQQRRLGLLNCGMILQLELNKDGKYSSIQAILLHVAMRISTGVLLSRQRHWPPVLSLLCNQMPLLIHLKIFSQLRINTTIYRPTEDALVASHRRPKLRFMSYLVLRHPKLNRLILPAARGPPWSFQGRGVDDCLVAQHVPYNRRPGDMPFHWERVTAIDLSPENRGTVKYDDEVLNAKVIRRATYRELLDTPIDAFILQPQLSQFTKDELTTSEGPACADDSYFSKVDHFGPREAAIFRRRGLRFQTMDSMIEEARQERTRSRVALTVGRTYCTSRR